MAATSATHLCMSNPCPLCTPQTADQNYGHGVVIVEGLVCPCNTVGHPGPCPYHSGEVNGWLIPACLCSLGPGSMCPEHGYVPHPESALSDADIDRIAERVVERLRALKAETGLPVLPRRRPFIHPDLLRADDDEEVP